MIYDGKKKLTKEEFAAECQRWTGHGVVEGSQLVVDGTVVAESAEVSSVHLLEHMRRIRTAMGLSQQQIATAIGTSRTQIGRMESLEVSPTIDFVLRYADAIGYNVVLKKKHV